MNSLWLFLKYKFLDDDCEVNYALPKPTAPGKEITFNWKKGFPLMTSSWNTSFFLPNKYIAYSKYNKS